MPPAPGLPVPRCDAAGRLVRRPEGRRGVTVATLLRHSFAAATT